MFLLDIHLVSVCLETNDVVMNQFKKNCLFDIVSKHTKQ